MKKMTHAERYFEEARKIINELDVQAIEMMAHAFAELRARDGRLFVLGVGGSAANASHAVNDFRKLCGIETYAPTDNVSELTARTNDDGWNSVFASWLKTSRISNRDVILVLSVGGGNASQDVSVNLIQAIKEAKENGAMVFGIVGRDGGFTKQYGDHVLVIPVIEPKHITPHTEAFQAIILHCLVSHPALQIQPTKW